MFEEHLTIWAFPLALPKAGKSSPARIAMMAITTSNSINVKPSEQRRLAVSFPEFDGGDFMSIWCGRRINQLCKLQAHESSDPKAMEPRPGLVIADQSRYWPTPQFVFQSQGTRPASLDYCAGRFRVSGPTQRVLYFLIHQSPSMTGRSCLP